MAHESENLTMVGIRDIGAAIRRRREAAGLTAARVAELADVSRRLLSELEQGKRPNAGLAAVLRVLSVLGLELRLGPRRLPGTSSGDRVSRV